MVSIIIGLGFYFKSVAYEKQKITTKTNTPSQDDSNEDKYDIQTKSYTIEVLYNGNSLKRHTYAEEGEDQNITPLVSFSKPVIISDKLYFVLTHLPFGCPENDNPCRNVM